MAVTKWAACLSYRYFVDLTRISRDIYFSTVCLPNFIFLEYSDICKSYTIAGQNYLTVSEEYHSFWGYYKMPPP